MSRLCKCPTLQLDSAAIERLSFFTQAIITNFMFTRQAYSITRKELASTSKWVNFYKIFPMLARSLDMFLWWLSTVPPPISMSLESRHNRSTCWK